MASQVSSNHEEPSDCPIVSSTSVDALGAASDATGSIHPRCSLTIRTSRRILLRILGTAAIMNVGEGLALSLGAASCSTHPPTTVPSKASAPTGTSSSEGTSIGDTPSVIGNTKQIPPNSAVPFDAVADNGPGVLIHLPDGRFVAYDAVCTHEGCTVAYNTKSKHLECPCHGSIFDPANAGQVLGGPAQMPLSLIKITIDKSTGAIVQE